MPGSKQTALLPLGLGLTPHLLSGTAPYDVGIDMHANITTSSCYVITTYHDGATGVSRVWEGSYCLQYIMPKKVIYLSTY